jgi:glycosyltransferase involved in cell wall biosynthesis
VTDGDSEEESATGKDGHCAGSHAAEIVCATGNCKNLDVYRQSSGQFAVSIASTTGPYCRLGLVSIAFRCEHLIQLSLSRVATVTNRLVLASGVRRGNGTIVTKASNQQVGVDHCQLKGVTKVMDISVVVPVHNESGSIQELIETICSTFDQPTLAIRACELILIDDGSTDETFQLAQQIAASKPRHAIRIISLRRNNGQTAAMQTGFEMAEGEIVVSLDGDLQNDPGDIPRLIEELEARDLDILCGRRKNRQDKWWTRKLPSWIANRLIGWATGIRISDYGCSLKVYRAEVLHQLRLIGEMHRFIPVWFSKVTSVNRIGEADVNHFPRRHGQTHYGLSRTFRVLLDLVSVLFFARFRNRPGHFFGMIGLALFALGALMLGISFIDKFLLGNDIGARPLLIVGSFSFFSGLQMICLGIIAEMLARTHVQSSQSVTSAILREYDNRCSSAPANRTSAIKYRKVA